MTVLVCTAIAAVYDWKTYKIPNVLCAAMLIAGLLVSVCFSSWEGLRMSFVGILIPFTILWLLYYCKMIGGGDIKLFCGIGAFAGTKVVVIMLLAFLLNGILAAGKLCHNRNLRERLWYLSGYVRECGEEGRLLTDYESGLDARIHFSFGILGAVMICYVAGMFSL